MKKKWTGLQVTGFIMFAVFGVVVAWQFKSIYLNAQETARQKASLQSYTAQLQDVVAMGEHYRNELLSLEADKNGLIAGNAFTPTDIELRRQLEDARLKAGLTDVRGAGIVITLNDLNVNSDQIIHDMHVVETVNQLKIAGAQAIAVNGQRIMPFSEQVCAGLKIRINRFRYSVPFVISAIGDPEKLYESASNSAVILSLRAKKISVTIGKTKDLLIPKYLGDVPKVLSGLAQAGDEAAEEIE